MTIPSRKSPRLRGRRPVLLATLVACLAPVAGCYNGDALVDRVRNDALRQRLEEIDLGMYEITMPRNTDTTETVEVEMELFGSIARYRQAEVEGLLEDKQYLLRHGVLMAVRETTSDDFADPDLSALRGRLLAATNSVLDEPLVQTVGFHKIRFVRH